MTAIAPEPRAPIDTPRRLLEAAGEIFAEHGFRGATIRDICGRAGVNIAAVNYHFGDKERLYAAALQYGYEQALAKYPPDLGLGPSPTPEARLGAFVRAFLLRILDPERPAWHGRLCYREMAEPTAALGSMVDANIRPHLALLGEIVRDVLGPEADDEAVFFCSLSVIGQCLHYFFGRPVLERVAPKLAAFTQADIERIARHVTRFSLAALRAIAAEPGEGPCTA